ncbi:hypothetical protein J6590_087956 [Homalodisca vitripennis]|nr:hypothetical protein J6590_087956 [Homalodisca vitripennis]
MSCRKIESDYVFCCCNQRLCLPLLISRLQFSPALPPPPPTCPDLPYYLNNLREARRTWNGCNTTDKRLTPEMVGQSFGSAADKRKLSQVTLVLEVDDYADPSLSRKLAAMMGCAVPERYNQKL